MHLRILSSTEICSSHSDLNQYERYYEISGTFRIADKQQDGNLAFCVEDGGIHSEEFTDHMYNDLMWYWSNA
jgi:hypothetical protein